MKTKNKKFKENIPYRLQRLKFLADKYGWKMLCETPKILVFESFHNWGYVAKSSVRMSINYLDLKVETMLHHPKKGFTCLAREGQFSMTLIENIFCNPRSHMPNQIRSTYVR